jgi:AbrB family looped-hinge helix DNA binding protein
MSGNSKKKCCGPISDQREKYKVEAIVSVDDRGQMVLPKELRNKFDLKPGEKLAVVIMEKDGKVCCLQLIKAQSFSDQVKGIVGSVEITKG